MPLPKDPDTLRIPAFMRRRSLRAGSKRPLLLTALDRKQAGVLPEGLRKKEPRKVLKKAARKISQDLIQQNLIFAEPIIDEKPLKPVRGTGQAQKISRAQKISLSPKITQSRKKTEIFSAPLLDTYVESSRSAKIPKQVRNDKKTVGEITHYYDKIKVAVIKLSGTLSIGDCIQYKLAEPTNDEESYEEIVESMEIDRSPVFKAGRGKEIGIKLRKKPREGSTVAIA